MITYVSNKAAAEEIVRQLTALGTRAIAVQADSGDLQSGNKIFQTLKSELKDDAFDILGRFLGIKTVVRTRPD